MKATVRRKTKETQVEVTIALDGSGAYDVQTDNKFLSHMMETWTRYAGFNLRLRATGDLDHHLVEDVAIAIGQAFREAFAAAPCRRIAYDIVAMDDALVLCAVDIVDRPYYEGRFAVPLWEHWFRSVAMEARINLHIDHLRGRDTHHLIEASFKAFGRALRRALEARDQEISTKGVADLSLQGAIDDALAAESSPHSEPGRAGA